MLLCLGLLVYTNTCCDVPRNKSLIFSALPSHCLEATSSLHSCVQRINYVYIHRIPTEMSVDRVSLLYTAVYRMHAEKNAMCSRAGWSFCDSWLCINVFEPAVAGCARLPIGLYLREVLPCLLGFAGVSAVKCSQQVLVDCSLVTANFVHACRCLLDRK